MQSYYCVDQVYGTNEINQFRERKLTDIHSCEWSLNTTAPANSMLRQYDTVKTTHYSTFMGYKKFHFIATVLFAYLKHTKLQM